MDTYTLERERLRAGASTCVALAREHARRIAAHPEYNAFLDVFPDLETQAAHADARRAAGETGPLHGMIVAVKDNICIADRHLSCGSRILEGFTALYDATAVRRLRDAGAVFIGRTNMDEFAMGSSTENSAYGPSRNPFDLARVPGGSSGGSAIAVAAGMAHAALGSETGGSVRQPAAFTGVLGIKPTYGRVSRHGLVAFASSLDQIGVFARSAQDAALVLDTISGADPMDATCAALPARGIAPCLRDAQDDYWRGLRVGIPREYLPGTLPSPILRAVDAAAEVFRAAGAEIVPVSLPRLDATIAVYAILATAEASSNLARFDGARYGVRAPGGSTAADAMLRSRSAGFGPEVKRRILLGTYALSAGYYDAYYLRAQRVRRLIRDDFDAAFRSVHLLLTPTTPTTAFRLGEKAADPLAMYFSDLFTASVNLAGLPAASIPAGRDENGLPVGVQLIAPAYREEDILRAARLCEIAGLDA